MLADGSHIDAAALDLWWRKFVGSFACGVHVYGFLDEEEPFPHEMFFCGVYFGYTLIAIFGITMMFLKVNVPLIVEAIVTVSASIFYIAGSIASMYHAENDFHLMYLSDQEESEHKFFRMCKIQSIISLIAALTFLLHATFSIDALVVNPTESQLNLLLVSPADRAASAKLELNLFCRPWAKYFKRRRAEEREDEEVGKSA